MKSGLFLDVVIRQSTAIFELLAGEDQALLIRRDTLFVLDFGFDVINGVAGLDVQGDGFADQSLHKDLHATAKAKDKMKSGLFLDVVIRQSTAIFELLAGENQALLIRRDTLFVLDFGFD